MSEVDCTELQKDIDNFAQWCDNNRLLLTMSKCKDMSISNQLNDISFDYSFGIPPLSVLTQSWTWGVYIDRKLTYV